MDSIVPARKVLDGLELNISAHIPVRSLIFFLIGTSTSREELQTELHDIQTQCTIIVIARIFNSISAPQIQNYQI